MSPSIRAQESMPRSSGPPGFQVDPVPNPFYAIEVATDPLLFQAAENAARRTPENFFASWTAPLLTNGPFFQLPEDAWQRLKSAERLYYRVLTSASQREWQQMVVSISDGQAERAPAIRLFDLFLLPAELVKPPEAEIVWGAVQDLEAVRTVRDLGAFEVLIYLHRFSPRRPFDPRAAEWAVIISHTPGGLDESVVFGVLRLGYQQHNLIADYAGFQEVHRPVGRERAAQEINAHIPPGPEPPEKVSGRDLSQLGNLWVYTVQDPPPDGSPGGTFMVHRLTGRLVYAATMSWEGQGTHLIP